MTLHTDTAPADTAPADTAADDATLATGAELTIRAERISEARAMDIAHDLWGLDGTVEWLWGEKDSNYRLSLPDGRAYLLKILTPGENPDVTRMHSLALRHVEDQAPSVPTQRVIPTLNGAFDVRITDNTGADRGVRLVTFAPGDVQKSHPTSPALRRSIGATLARLQGALASFTHPAAHALITWDMAQFPTLRPHIALCTPDLQPWLTDVMTAYETRIAPVLDQLPAQVIHNDFNQDNLLVDPAHPDVLSGVIDFGDMLHSARLFDMGVALAYQLVPNDPLGAACDVLRGYAQAGGRLTQAEIDLLWTAVKCRNAMRLLIPAWQCTLFPERETYFTRNRPISEANIRAIAGIDDAIATPALAAALKI